MRKRIFAGLALAIAASNAQAQETIDVSKITCEQYALFQVADPQSSPTGRGRLEVSSARRALGPV
jgi:hypothetical protein